MTYLSPCFSSFLPFFRSIVEKGPGLVGLTTPNSRACHLFFNFFAETKVRPFDTCSYRNFRYTCFVQRQKAVDAINALTTETDGTLPFPSPFF